MYFFFGGGELDFLINLTNYTPISSSGKISNTNEVVYTLIDHSYTCVTNPGQYEPTYSSCIQTPTTHSSYVFALITHQLCSHPPTINLNLPCTHTLTRADTLTTRSEIVFIVTWFTVLDFKVFSGTIVIELYQEIRVKKKIFIHSHLQVSFWISRFLMSVDMEFHTIYLTILVSLLSP